MSTPEQDIKPDSQAMPDLNAQAKAEILAEINELQERARKNADAEIARQLAAGKLANPLSLIVGKWPGDETLEELEAMLRK